MHETVPSFNYLRAWEEHKEELQSTISRVISSGCLILGEEVSSFEREFAQFVGARFAIAVSSGTDALIVAMRSLGVGYGDEVITVANGPIPTIAAIRAVGAVPRFVDVNAENLQMCPNELRRTISPRTRGVIPIHLYGYPASTDEIVEICSHIGVPVIGDCAQAHGTYVGTHHAGTIAAIGCFSFYPTKNLGAFGDGGMCITNDPELATKMREQAHYGFRGERIAHSEGLNCRLDELQAAILRVRLKYLAVGLARRNEIATRYLSELADCDLALPAVPSYGQHSWHQFVVRSPERWHWIEWLRSQSIQTGIHYQHPVHLMPAFKWLGYERGSLPCSERACDEVFSLPMFPELTNDEVTVVIDAIQARPSTSRLSSAMFPLSESLPSIDSTQAVPQETRQPRAAVVAASFANHPIRNSL